MTVPCLGIVNGRLCVVSLAMLAAAVVSSAGCETLDAYPPPNLPPTSVERMRQLLSEVPDEPLQRRLLARLDEVYATWPVRQAGLFAPPREPGPPTSVLALRDQLAEVPDAVLRGQLTAQAELLAQQWTTGNRDGDRPVGWFLVPQRVRVDAFTAFKSTEDGVPYLEARVQVLDADDNPLRAVGKFRLELFRFERGTPDPRGARLALWNIDVQTHDDNTRYYDQLIDGYTFALDLEGLNPGSGIDAAPDRPGLGGAKYVLEATFTRLDGRRVYPSHYRYVEVPRDPTGQLATATNARSGPRRPSPNRLRSSTSRGTSRDGTRPGGGGLGALAPGLPGDDGPNPANR